MQSTSIEIRSEAVDFLLIFLFCFSFVSFEMICRKKRALSEWLIAPNTKWCGRGQTAEKYNQLGGASKADKCCRRHDHCRFNIHAFTTKYDLINMRPFTISHCSCDQRFVLFPFYYRRCYRGAATTRFECVVRFVFELRKHRAPVMRFVAMHSHSRQRDFPRLAGDLHGFW